MEYLTAESLKCTLPSYLQIFYTIQNIREIWNKDQIDKNAYEHYPYQNIISILGERGSGKTTVFSTIKMLLTDGKTEAQKKARENFFVNKETGQITKVEQNEVEKIKKAVFERDNHLPLIVPEVLEDGTDILGVILLSIKGILNKSKKEIDAHYADVERNTKEFSSCICTKENRIDTLWNEVFSIYLMRTEEYAKISRETYSNFKDYSKERQNSLASEIELRGKIYELFSELSDIFSSRGKKSLTFIYIDDADINQNRCAETMDVILRYLKHPSVVVFVSGDKTKLNSELLFYELKKARVSTDNMEVRKGKEIYVQELLKKILPYSNRFELQNIRNKEKRILQYPGRENNADRKSFEEDLTRVFQKQNTKEQSHKLLMDSVFSIFDYKPRGIISLWEGIRKIFPERIERTDGEEYTRMMYQSLLDNIVNSNEKLRRNEDIIKRCLILDGIDKNIHMEIKYELFQNYIIGELGEFEMHESGKNLQSKWNRQEEFICILHLFYFFEVILLDEENESIDGQKYSELLNLIIVGSGKEKIYYRTQTATEALSLFDLLSDVMTLQQQGEIYSNIEYFRSYQNVIETMKQKGYTPLENALDYEWLNHYNGVTANFKENYGKIVAEVIALFSGVEFDYGLLKKERDYKELNLEKKEKSENKENSENKEKLKTELLKTGLKQIENSVVHEAKIRLVKQMAKRQNKSSLFSENGIVEGELKKIVREKTERLEAIKSGQLISLLHWEFTGNEIREITNYSKPDTWNVYKIINFIEILKNALKRNIEGLYNQNSSSCTNVRNCLEKKDGGMTVYYLPQIKNEIKIMEELFNEFLGKNEIPDYIGDTLASILKKMHFSENEKDMTNSFEYGELREFMENSTETEGADEETEKADEETEIFGMKDEGSSEAWKTRRVNVVHDLLQILINIYSISKLEEYQQDFFFINQKELEELKKLKELKELNDTKAHVKTYGYQHINAYFFYATDEALGEKKKENEMFNRIGQIRNELLRREERYWIEEINMEKLNSFFNMIKDDTLYQDIKFVKNELESRQFIPKKQWEELIKKIKLYISILQNQDSAMSYYAVSLELTLKQLRYKKKPIQTAPILSEIEQEEYRKIYNVEYNNLVLCVKEILARRDRKLEKQNCKN